MSSGQSFVDGAKGVPRPKAGMNADETARFSRLKQLRDDVRAGRMTLAEANREWQKVAAPAHAWKVTPPKT